MESHGIYLWFKLSNMPFTYITPCVNKCTKYFCYVPTEQFLCAACEAWLTALIYELAWPTVWCSSCMQAAISLLLHDSFSVTFGLFSTYSLYSHRYRQSYVLTPCGSVCTTTHLQSCCGVYWVCPVFSSIQVTTWSAVDNWPATLYVPCS